MFVLWHNVFCARHLSFRSLELFHTCSFQLSDYHGYMIDFYVCMFNCVSFRVAVLKAIELSCSILIILCYYSLFFAFVLSLFLSWKLSAFKGLNANRFGFSRLQPDSCGDAGSFLNSPTWLSSVAPLGVGVTLLHQLTAFLLRVLSPWSPELVWLLVCHSSRLRLHPLRLWFLCLLVFIVNIPVMRTVICL